MAVVGIDAHKHSHTLVAVDSGGAKLGEKTVEATSAGHAEALRWALGKFGPDLLWAVEDNRSVTGLLERELMAAFQRVVRVPPHLMARSRGPARAWGKSDPIDAIAVARAVLREPDLPVAFHDQASWELKLLVDRRDDLVGQRVEAMNRLFGRLHQLSPERPKPVKLQWATRRQALNDWLLEQPGLLAELSRQEVADIGYFSDSIEVLTKQIAIRVHELGSTLLSLPGCAELIAAKLISETANVDRFRNEAAFARYAGIAPVPMWSGSTECRLRLARSGNRQCNSAIHRIAVVQIRLDGPGRAYYQRRRADGDSGMGALRCLKRRLCRIVYNRLRADYARRTGPVVDAAEPLTGVKSSMPAWQASMDLAASLETEDRIEDELAEDDDDELPPTDDE
ncbi:transposase [Mycobacterium sp. OAS707]|uniref:IS110 family transposase n=1 Tax=Mycobacterium sp. OAS707 TaxID=2663822 RepID=UPI0019E8349A|nr:IS110 family transposase [Mycobacterium sp. OAS707]MBE1552209.1 transposase [Mycobacterium sp. OAS707]